MILLHIKRMIQLIFILILMSMISACNQAPQLKTNEEITKKVMDIRTFLYTNSQYVNAAFQTKNLDMNTTVSRVKDSYTADDLHAWADETFKKIEDLQKQATSYPADAMKRSVMLLEEEKTALLQFKQQIDQRPLTQWDTEWTNTVNSFRDISLKAS